MGGGSQRRKEGYFRKDPVVYIHGALMTAGQMTPALQYYLQHGYDESEVFATSFSVGRLQDGPDTTVECIFAKEVRRSESAIAESMRVGYIPDGLARAYDRNSSSKALPKSGLYVLECGARVNSRKNDHCGDSRSKAIPARVPLRGPHRK